MRLSGLIVLLYAFSHSYFGAGSLKNAFGSMPSAGPERVFALLFGLSWLLLFAGGLLLFAKKRAGVMVSRAAAAGSAAIQLAGAAVFWKSGALDMNFLLFTLARPAYGIFLFAMLPRFARDAGSHAPVKTSVTLLVLGSGAIMPWIAFLGVNALAAGNAVPAHAPGPFISLFMSLWSMLPFGVLLLTLRLWPMPAERTIALACGLAGAAAASLYCYSLIWLQQGNTFIMALLPPVVFAGEALGLASGRLAASLFRSEPN